MSDLLTALHMLVDELHHLTRIETVGLSEIDEQAGKARFGLPRSTGAFPIAFALTS